jgi:putative ABC transport system substrate-binding protein
MRSRREFVAALAATALQCAGVRAQPARPVIGFLNSATPKLYTFNVEAFRQGLQEQGFVDGKNVTIEFRWAEGDYERLPALARELVDRRVLAIAATGDVSSARAAQAASSTTPIVFTIGGDPVKFGLVDSYNRPGRNLTGISLISSTMGGKRVELLHEIAPNAVIGLLMNPDNPNAALERRDAEAAAKSLGHATFVVDARNSGDFDAAFEGFVRRRGGALFVGTDPMLLSQRERLVAFAAERRVPAIYFVREYAAAGGLLSYGASIRFMYRQAGVYIGRILRGASPAELPVEQPTRFQLVINGKIAKFLGLTLPEKLVAIADEVIE